MPLARVPRCATGLQGKGPVICGGAWGVWIAVEGRPRLHCEPIVPAVELKDAPQGPSYRTPLTPRGPSRRDHEDRGADDRSGAVRSKRPAAALQPNQFPSMRS